MGLLETLGVEKGLEEIFLVLRLSPEQQQTIIRDLEEVLGLTISEKALQKLPEEKRSLKGLQQALPPAQYREVLQEAFDEIMPGFGEALLSKASMGQKAQVQAIVDRMEAISTSLTG